MIPTNPIPNPIPISSVVEVPFLSPESILSKDSGDKKGSFANTLNFFDKGGRPPKLERNYFFSQAEKKIIFEPNLEIFEGIPNSENAPNYLVRTYKINCTKELLNEINNFVATAFKPFAGMKRKKRISFQFQQANWEANRSRQDMDLERMKLLAFNYMEEKKNTKLLFTRNKYGTVGYMFLPYLNMLHPQYAKKQLKKIENLPYGLGITLTTRYSKEESINHSIKRLNECFHTFMIYLGRYLVKKLQYFAVREIAGGNGVTHIHGTIFNQLYIPQTVIKSLWYKITGDSYKVWVSARNTKAKKYLSKYLTKTLKGELTNSVVALWSCGQRLFSTSEDLFQELETEEDDESYKYISYKWEFVGIVFECELEGIYEFERVVINGEVSYRGFT